MDGFGEGLGLDFRQGALPGRAPQIAVGAIGLVGVQDQRIAAGARRAQLGGDVLGSRGVDGDDRPTGVLAG